MTLSPAILLTAALLGQSALAVVELPDDPAARLEFMKQALAQYEVRSEDRTAAYPLQTAPVLRFTNPVGGSKDGALFLWLRDEGRPAAAGQIYWNPQRVWRLEFSSLSTAPVVATAKDGTGWSPSRGGLEPAPVPGAAPPAETPEARFRQMRELAKGFRASHHYQGKVWNELRLLTKPFARYGGPHSEVLDGALFCFTYGTDPEVFLTLEARGTDQRAKWYYAFAPMTSYAVNASWKEQTVWTLPQRWKVMKNPNEPFHVRDIAVTPIDDLPKPQGGQP